MMWRYAAAIIASAAIAVFKWFVPDKTLPDTPPLKSWSISFTYIPNGDAALRAKSVLWVDAADTQSAYLIAKKQMPGAKFGAIMPGHHNGAF